MGGKESVGEQTQLTSTDRSLDAAIHSQFAEDVVDVSFDRTRGDNQLGRDLGVGETCRKQLQDFEFTGAQGFSRMVERRGWSLERGLCSYPFLNIWLLVNGEEL